MSLNHFYGTRKYTMIRIVVDKRERNGAIPHMEAMVDANNVAYAARSRANGGGKILYCTKTITVGDYAWVIDGQLIALAERKTWADMVATVTGDRNLSQREGMLSVRARGVLTFYIIEGVMNAADKTTVGTMSMATLRTVLRRNMLRGMPWVQVLDTVGTAKFVVNFARDVLFRRSADMHADAALILDGDFRNELKALCKKHEDNAAAQALLTRIRGAKQAEQTLQELDQDDVQGGNDSDDKHVTPTFLLNRKECSTMATVEALWKSFPGVSATSAPTFRRFITFVDFFTSKPSSLIKRLTDLELPSGKRLGKSRATSVANAHGDSRLQQIIMTEIIGAKKAAAVLEHYTINEIVAMSSADDLAGVKLNGRRIGKTAEKILTVLQFTDISGGEAQNL